MHLQDGVLVCLNCDEAFPSWDADPLCPRCREFEAVIELLAARYPGTVDYRTRNSDLFDLLDEGGQVIATITEREMTTTWNEAE